MKKMRAKVKEVTAPRGLLYWSPQQMVDKLNPIIQGWKNYYGSVDPAVATVLVESGLAYCPETDAVLEQKAQTQPSASQEGCRSVRGAGFETSERLRT